MCANVCVCVPREQVGRCVCSSVSVCGCAHMLVAACTCVLLCVDRCARVCRVQGQMECCASFWKHQTFSPASSARTEGPPRGWIFLFYWPRDFTVRVVWWPR